MKASEETAASPDEKIVDFPETPETPETQPADPAPANEPAAAPEEEPAAAPEEPQEPAEDPAAPTTAPGAKMNAFQRGALRALGIGGLVQKVEESEAARAIVAAENTRLKTENARLAAEVSRLNAETPQKIAEAAKARENAVSQGVRNELTSLGIDAKDAPSQLTAGQTENVVTFAEFQAKSHMERNEFIRNGGKIAKE
jgi:hypothetical protein